MPVQQEFQWTNFRKKFSHIERMDHDRPLLVCLVCSVPKSEEKKVLIFQMFSLIENVDPSRLRFEILWIGDFDGIPQDFFSKCPSSIIGNKCFPSLMNPIRVRIYLRRKNADLIDIRFMSPSPWRRFLFFGFSNVLTESNILEFESFLEINNGKKGMSGTFQEISRSEQPIGNIPNASLKGDEEQVQVQKELVQDFLHKYTSLCRTVVRTRDFREGRMGLSILRKALGTVCSCVAPSKGALRVLMYHRVVDTLDMDILSVTPFAFVQQMIWLREEGWEVLPLREALLRLENGSLPERAVSITFDDGYRDNYEEAYPVLLNLGYPATIFPVTGFVLGETEHRRYSGKNPKVPYLTIEQIREMKEAGINFGGHTHTHPLLTKISFEMVIDEIQQAKKLLEDWTGEKSTLFAYPNGIYGKEHFRILDALGYEAALTVRPGANRPGTYRFALLRTEVSGRDSLGDFIRKMNGGFDLMHRMTQGVRGFYR